MMQDERQPVLILIAEDDDDDYLLITEAFEESRLANELRRVRDGEELMDYLLHNGKYADQADAPRPTIILLDLNMPRKDGREALAEIKSHPNLKSIPVIVLTTSKAEEDILTAYGVGANSFIRKPVSFDAFINTVKVLKEYWFEIVALPAASR